MATPAELRPGTLNHLALQRTQIPPAPDESYLKSVEGLTNTTGPLPEVVKVDIPRLRADVKYWADEASWWTGIASEVSGAEIKDSSSLLRPFLGGYNAASSHLTAFTRAAPGQLTQTSTKVRDAADAYAHASGGMGKRQIPVADQLPELRRFSPANHNAGKDFPTLNRSAAIDPQDPSGLKSSLEVLQANAGSSIDLNPLDDAKIGAEAKANFDVIRKALSGTTSISGKELAGALEAGFGASTSAEISLSPTKLQGSLGGFAGADATVSGSATAGPFSVTGQAGVTAGPGAEATGLFGMGEDGKFHITAGATLSPLLGAKLGAGVAVDMDKLLGKPSIVTMPTWTTTAEQIDAQLKALDNWGGQLSGAVAIVASKSAVVGQIGVVLQAALHSFRNVYGIVRAGSLSYPSESARVHSIWNMAARSASDSSKHMSRTNATGYWDSNAGAMYNNLIARHANAAYEVAVASSFICDCLEELTTSLDRLFGVAIATATNVGAKVDAGIKICLSCASDAIAVPIARNLLATAVNQLDTIKSALGYAISGFEQSAAQLGGLVSSASDSVGSASQGQWPTA